MQGVKWVMAAAVAVLPGFAPGSAAGADVGAIPFSRLGQPGGPAQLDPAGRLSGAPVMADGADVARSLGARGADSHWLRDYANADGTPVDATGAKDAAFALGRCLAAGPCRIGAGTFLLDSAVSVPARGGAILGEGWDEAGPGSGSWFKIARAGFKPIDAGGNRGFAIRDVAFSQVQPVPGSTFAPIAYDYVITSSGGSIIVDNVFLFGVTNGINLTTTPFGGGGGRHRISRISGQVFGVAVHADVVVDTMTLHDVHLWPFWMFAQSEFGASQLAAVYAWQRDNTVAVLSRRNDNPMISNVFCFGCLTPLWFAENQTTRADGRGPTSSAFVSNIDADGCRFGLLATATGTTATISRLHSQGTDLSTGGVIAGSAGVMIDDPARDGLGTGVGYVRLDMDHSYSAKTDLGGLVNLGSNGVVRMTDPTISEWDRYGRGAFAVRGRHGIAGNQVTVSNPVFLLGTSNTLDVVAPTILPSGSVRACTAAASGEMCLAADGATLQRKP